MAIKAIEDSIKDIDDEEKDVRKEMHSGYIYWEDRGMYVGFLDATDLL